MNKETALSEYNRLITRVQKENRGLEKEPGYEIHHIYPTCLGGEDEDYNKIKFTYNEHLAAHFLLPFIYEHPDLFWAAFMMSERFECVPYDNLYETIKERAYESQKEKAVEGNKQKHNKGRRYYNNGEKNLFLKPAEPVPPGYKPGKLQKTPDYKWYNNGIENRYFVTPPDDSWVPGRIGKLGPKNKIAVTDRETTWYVDEEHLSTLLTAGAVLGTNEKGKKKDNLRNTKWYYNPETSKSWRGIEGKQPEGFIPGRVKWKI